MQAHEDVHSVLLLTPQDLEHPRLSNKNVEAFCGILISLDISLKIILCLNKFGKTA